MQDKERHPLLIKAIDFLSTLTNQHGRNLSMPANYRYQKSDLAPILGYDQWAGWLIIVEWFWLIILAKLGVMPKSDRKYLKKKNLFILLREITTKWQDKIEKDTGHDILALLQLMRQYLPLPLHKWLHYGATSYDPICTAYALVLNVCFEGPFWSKLKAVDQIWRERIKENAKVLQMGRTHLQDALPITVGFWLSHLHRRYVKSARNALKLCREVPGKFSGATGTYAAQNLLFKTTRGEAMLMERLGLPVAEVSTQIAAPEETARFYYELVLLSGVLANLGDDTRLLQSSFCGEILTESSRSSTMSHKRSNPIIAENACGMHVDVIAENMKLTLTLISNLQRDLRWSSVMRDFCAVMVYNYNQLCGAEKLLESLRVDKDRCKTNFEVNGPYVVAEPLHLFLQCRGVEKAHKVVNESVVPQAREDRGNLAQAMENILVFSPELNEIWRTAPDDLNNVLNHPETYIGKAVEISEEEAVNVL